MRHGRAVSARVPDQAAGPERIALFRPVQLSHLCAQSPGLLQRQLPAALLQAQDRFRLDPEEEGAAVPGFPYREMQGLLCRRSLHRGVRRLDRGDHRPAEGRRGRHPAPLPRADVAGRRSARLRVGAGVQGEDRFAREALFPLHHFRGAGYGCRCLLARFRRRGGVRQFPPHPLRVGRAVAQPRVQDEHRGGAGVGPQLFPG